MQQIYRGTPMPKCDFTKVAKQSKAILLKSHFNVGVILQIYCILSEHLLLRAPLNGCFCRVFHKKLHLRCFTGFWIRLTINCKNFSELDWYPDWKLETFHDGVNAIKIKINNTVTTHVVCQVKKSYFELSTVYITLDIARINKHQ